MTVNDFITAPAVVVGGGIAGLSTALSLEGCVVASGAPVGDGASRLAQGGIAAAIGPGDAPAQHSADTLRVSAGLAAEDVAALVTDAAPRRIAWLREIGVAFDVDANGSLVLGREAGHGRHRIVHAGGDRTGAAVMQALAWAARNRPDIRLLEGFALVDLVTCGARVAGVLLEAAGGSRLAVLAPHVVLATGGVGAAFEHTTNPASSQGAGLAAAARCGVRLADLEFMQFHPTALAVAGDPQPLLTEALRGAGALLLDDRDRRFMREIHADAELAPRDVVARAVAARRRAGRAVFLDATGIRALGERFPGAVAIARAAGFDPGRQPLPVAAAAHFHMGGIATDADGATSLPGLWACGEVACTGLHGGNRLASNSLLEGLVFGERIARALRVASMPVPRGPLEVARRARLPAADPARLGVLRRLVGESLGPLRDGASLSAARDRLAAWRCESRAEEDVTAVGGLLVAAALDRRESRGAHYRSDFPAPSAGTPARGFVSPQATAVESVDPARSRVA
ncbi:MAG TPA: L-aspartate oxidase [Steroidobacteraceae bacterium]|nr:L-aspartate oxidase [Steroidobacteraceae bacterium]